MMRKVKIKKVKGKLYTSNFSKIRKHDSCIRISVARFNPNWLRKDDYDLWFEDLAPEIELLTKIKKKEIDWAEYVKIYKEQLRQEPAQNQLYKLKFLLDEGIDVCIYCYEASDNPECHRHIISEVFSNLGYHVTEI